MTQPHAWEAGHQNARLPINSRRAFESQHDGQQVGLPPSLDSHSFKEQLEVASVRVQRVRGPFHDSHERDHFSGYDVITSPAELADRNFDFLFVTLDNASLRAEAGLELVREIGRALRDTNTGVILAAVGIGVRAWFIHESGLAEEQVTMGNTGALIHEVAAANLPADPSLDPDLLRQADYAVKHLGPVVFFIDDSAPEVSQAFAAAYSGPGVHPASVGSAAESAVGVAVIAPFLAWGFSTSSPSPRSTHRTSCGSSARTACARSKSSARSGPPVRQPPSRPPRRACWRCSSN